MGLPIITVENISKHYCLGQIGAGTLRASADRFLNRIFRSYSKPLASMGPEANSESTSDLWALRDVSFEVVPGEVLGIIGQNGAGIARMDREKS